MKSFASLAILACMQPLAALAAVSHPVSTDVYRAMLHYRGTPGAEHSVPFTDAAMGTPGLLAQMLTDASSPYSELNDAPGFTNEVWWPDFVERIAPGLPYDAALQSMQWQLGLTRARPGIDIDVTPEQVAAYRGREAAAGAVKAGIPVGIYATALDRHYPNVATAAKEAVAVQLLAEQMEAFPRERWDSAAIRGELYERYTQSLPRLPDISEEETHYLMGILTTSIASGVTSLHQGTPQLPAAYRVARLTAAYADASGYTSDRPLCKDDAPAPGRPRGREAVSGTQALCFVAATDRGVLAWYRHEVRREHARILAGPRQQQKHDKTGLLTLLGIVMPVLDLAALVEVAEASAAAEIAEARLESAEATAEADAALQRSTRLTCGVRAP